MHFRIVTLGYIFALEPSRKISVLLSMHSPQIGQVFVEPNITMKGVDLESWIVLSFLEAHSVEWQS